MTVTTTASAAAGRIADYEEQHGRVAVELAAHASVPVAVTPDLLHLIRINFFLDPPDELDYDAEAKLLLSSMCREVDRDLYEMDADVRVVLLARLEQRWGTERLQEVARLLLQYSERGAPWAHWPELERAQQLTAWNFLDPSLAVEWLNRAEQATGGRGNETAWFVAMRQDFARLQERNQAPVVAPTVEPAVLTDALLRLDYEEQVAAFERAMEVTYFAGFLIQGGEQHGQRWLASRLIRSIGADVLLFTCRPGDETLDALFERTMSPFMPDGRMSSWLDWLVEQNESRDLVLVFDLADQARPEVIDELITRFWFTLRREQSMRLGPDSGRHLVMLLLDHRATARLPDFLVNADPEASVREWSFVTLPRLRPFTPDAMRRWLDENRAVLPRELTADADATVEELMELMGGLPEPALRRLAERSRVPWTEVDTVWSAATAPRIPAIPEAVAALAREYDEVRASQPSGPERTHALDEIAHRMRGLVVHDQLLPELTASTSAGFRLVAAVQLQAKPDPDYVPWLADRFTLDQPFVQYHAAEALLEATRRLEDSVIGDLGREVSRARGALIDPSSGRAAVLHEAARIVEERSSPGLGEWPVSKLWRPGLTIRVKFLEGAASLQRKVERFAREWTQFANIEFAFFPPGSTEPAEERLSFSADPGSWAALGTDALVFSEDAPTINFGWLKPNTDDEEISRVVVHNFGHVLGLVHEHQQPNARLKWNREEVYRLFSGPPNNWDKAMIDNNMLARYRQSSVIPYRPYDPDSIMLYQFPASLFQNKKPTKNNTRLSASDKEFIARLYPGRTWPPAPARPVPARKRPAQKGSK